MEVARAATGIKAFQLLAFTLVNSQDIQIKQLIGIGFLSAIHVMWLNEWTFSFVSASLLMLLVTFALSWGLQKGLCKQAEI